MNLKSLISNVRKDMVEDTLGFPLNQCLGFREHSCLFGGHLSFLAIRKHSQHMDDGYTVYTFTGGIYFWVFHDIEQ